MCELDGVNFAKDGFPNSCCLLQHQQRSDSRPSQERFSEHLQTANWINRLAFHFTQNGPLIGGPHHVALAVVVVWDAIAAPAANTKVWRSGLLDLSLIIEEEFE